MAVRKVLAPLQGSTKGGGGVQVPCPPCETCRITTGLGSTAYVMSQGTALHVLSSLQKQSWGKKGFGRPPGWAVLWRCQEGVLQCRFATREVKQM